MCLPVCKPIEFVHTAVKFSQKSVVCTKFFGFLEVYRIYKNLVDKRCEYGIILILVVRWATHTFKEVKGLSEPTLYENSISLETLVLAAQKGEEEAYSALVLRLLPFVRRQATNYKCTELEADDLLQEGFIGMLSAVRKFDCTAQKPFLPYVCRSIQNSMLSALRKTAGAKGQAVTVPLEEDLVEFSAPSLEEMQDLREECESVWQHVTTRLSNTEKQVLRFFLNGLSYEEIAMQLAMNAKSVDNALQRVRRKLKK